MKESDEIFERKRARQQQALVEQIRLARHQRIALALIALPQRASAALVERARDEVQRWARDSLCSAEYIERWTAILALKPDDIAAVITSDAEGWGPALRQNSPWVGDVDSVVSIAKSTS